jgi:hypothetical protein
MNRRKDVLNMAGANKSRNIQLGEGCGIFSSGARLRAIQCVAVPSR